jgi:hypothetical protein
MGDLSPFDFFRQETSNPDVIVRTEAMTKILVIVALMGAERVRNEMLPYLQTKLEDLDQVILALAIKLGDMVPYVGGPSHATSLIEALEVLCGTEEITARTAAAASTAKVRLSCWPASRQPLLLIVVPIPSPPLTAQVISHLNPDMADQVGEFFEMFKRMSNEVRHVMSCHRVA